MTDDLKQKIATACESYITEKGISRNELARISGVNPAYISAIMSGEYNYKNSRTGVLSPIADRWFTLLANAVGYKLQKEYWPFVKTQQFVEIIAELEDAKACAYTRALIGETGCGKTYTIERFRAANPIGCYVVKCHKYYTLRDIVDKIMDAVGINEPGNISKKLDRINIELWRMYRCGQHPIIILDEAENLTLSAIQMLKALYDFLKNACAIVLIGTNQLVKTLNRMRELDKPGAPQFYRRIKAGIRNITPCDPLFSAFLESIEDKGLKKLLINTCDNYGELSDYLTPVLREADRVNRPLTESLFRIVNKLSI